MVIEHGTAAGLTSVSHCYGATGALENVTISVPEGRMVGLIGPDGVGKSTLLGLVAGVRRIQSGTVSTLEVPWQSSTNAWSGVISASP